MSRADARGVLVVENEVDLAVTYQRLLHRHGYRVVAAGTRREALVILAEESLTVVITDVRLPDGDGLDVVRTATAASPRTQAIVVTAQSSEAVRLAAFEAGASAYFRKPFSSPELIAAVNDLARPASSV